MDSVRLVVPSACRPAKRTAVLTWAEGMGAVKSMARSGVPWMFCDSRGSRENQLPDDEPAIKTSMSGHGIAVSPDGKWLWNANKTYDAVFIYSLPDIKLVGRVHLPKLMPPGMTL